MINFFHFLSLFLSFSSSLSPASFFFFLLLLLLSLLDRRLLLVLHLSAFFNPTLVIVVAVMVTVVVIGSRTYTPGHFLPDFPPKEKYTQRVVYYCIIVMMLSTERRYLRGCATWS